MPADRTKIALNGDSISLFKKKTYGLYPLNCLRNGLPQPLFLITFPALRPKTSPRRFCFKESPKNREGRKP